ncbi:hypothetical protein [Deinococcus yunweiensis]|uniref:hypothetical protein n=1 Tax=Deinococcus yunweiensis TaxID=367282 RepID=UPI00398EFFA7
MTEQTVPLDHVLHVLPLSSRERLLHLQRRGVEVQCLSTPGGLPPLWLVARVGTQTIRTSDHPWIAPALVYELVQLTEALVN